jgi:hypothetical protein
MSADPAPLVFFQVEHSRLQAGRHASNPIVFQAGRGLADLAEKANDKNILV